MLDVAERVVDLCAHTSNASARRALVDGNVASVVSTTVIAVYVVVAACSNLVVVADHTVLELFVVHAGGTSLPLTPPGASTHGNAFMRDPHTTPVRADTAAVVAGTTATDPVEANATHLVVVAHVHVLVGRARSEEHTSELQSHV